jgi:hypothetical protein
MRFTFFILILLGLSSSLLAQDLSADSLLADLSQTDVKENLLPERMLLSQRVFWGEKGVFRAVGIAPKLSAENRQKELRVRRKMFKIHQGLGIATAAGMIAQAVVGSKLYNFDASSGGDYLKLKRTHEGLATGLNIAYGTTALMAFTSPPKQIHRKGVSNMGIHRALSYVHLTGMITTNVLSNKLESNYEKIKPYHRAAAYTTFASYLAAIAIIKFEF